MALIKQEERLTVRRMKGEQEEAIVAGANEQQAGRHSVWKELKTPSVSHFNSLTYQRWQKLNYYITKQLHGTVEVSSYQRSQTGK